MTVTSRCDVLFLSMPFGPLQQPSIGLSLLRAQLPDVATRIEYFTLPFADRIGSELYNFVAVTAPNDAVLGDWLFAEALFGPSRPRPLPPVDDYIESVLRPADPDAPLDDGRVAKLLEARRLAGEFIEDCLEWVRALEPCVVGFSSVFVQQAASLALARRIKEAMPGTTVLFGGANCEGVMGLELVRRFPWVDAALSGEGEAVIADLVAAALEGKALDDIPGVYCRDNLHLKPTDRPVNAPMVTSMDALPYPDYDDFFAQWAATATSARLEPLVLFESSRGCWWGTAQHCTFCGLNGSTMTFRSKSAARALDELRYLGERYPGRFILAVDNILDVRYFQDLIPDLAASGLDLDLFYALKANLRKEQLRALRDAGIVKVQPGIESLSDEILRLMRKGEKALENIQLLKWCRELGLQPAWNFIWGFPREPIAEYRRMAEEVPLLSHLTPPQIAKPIRLDRFSPNFEIGEALGFTDIEPCPAYAHVYPFDADALRNLAYHFAHRHQDARDVRQYTAPLGRAVARWQRDHADSELFQVAQGDELWIWDLRPGGGDELTRLTGVERRCYEACDRARTLGWLAGHAGNGGVPLPAADIEDRLQPLVAAGIMLRHDDRFLSLAIPGNPEQSVPAPAA